MSLLAAVAALQLSQDQFTKIVDIAIRGAEALLVFVLAYLGWKARQFQIVKTIEKNQTILDNAAPPAVAAVYNETVKDLKDPTKPEAGSWTSATKIAARDTAVDKILGAFPEQAAYLEANGVKVRSMLEHSVEKGVVALDAAIAAATSNATQADAVTKAADAVTKAVDATTADTTTPSSAERPAPR